LKKFGALLRLHDHSCGVHNHPWSHLHADDLDNGPRSANQTRESFCCVRGNLEGDKLVRFLLQEPCTKT
jgi:hypothetical protein